MHPDITYANASTVLRVQVPSGSTERKSMYATVFKRLMVPV